MYLPLLNNDNIIKICSRIKVKERKLVYAFGQKLQFIFHKLVIMDLNDKKTMNQKKQLNSLELSGCS